MMKLKQISLTLFLLVSLVLYSFLGYSLLSNLLLKIQLQLALSRANIKSNTKCILYWLPMWDDKTFSFGSDKYEPFKHCKFKNCFATSDKDIAPIERFDAIVFHAAQYDPSYDVPLIRIPHQRYIFATMETPLTAYSHAGDLKLYDSFYNWTMTYRLDSDIVMSYGYIVENTTNYIMPDIEFVNNKTHLAAWLVSHCRTTNNRQNVYEDLQNFLDIDVYGDCGVLKCPADHGNSRNIAGCYDYISEKYKFFLSFENAHCKDYVTEKLYMVLERNIVPIVYGLSDYENIFPHNSVIVVDKFANMKQLANYILFLDKNPKEYLKYFEWKKHYYVGKNGHRTACALCQILNDPLQPQKIYTDIYTWWWGKNKSYCKFIPHTIGNVP